MPTQERLRGLSFRFQQQLMAFFTIKLRDYPDLADKTWVTEQYDRHVLGDSRLAGIQAPRARVLGVRSSSLLHSRRDTGSG